MNDVIVTRHKYHIVRSLTGCTVRQEGANGTVLETTVPADEDTPVFAHSGRWSIEGDEDVTVTEVFSGALIAGGNGGGGAAVIKPATGETVIPLTASELTIRHATWFENAEKTSITVNPAPWKNEVMTCYLKAEAPVELSGVAWLYGEPTMTAGYTYVIALQQIDAAIVLANLAYTIPQ